MNSIEVTFFFAFCCAILNVALTTSSSSTLEEKKQQYEKFKKECGVPRPPITGRIHGGGKVTDQYRHPWMVYIKVQQPTGMLFFGDRKLSCGGTLIGPRHVLTAAHCVYYDKEGKLIKYENNKIGVFMGNIDRKVMTKEPSKYKYEVAEVRVNGLQITTAKNSREMRYINDMAILVLEKDVQILPNVAPICLHSTQAIQISPKAHKVASVTGWGLTNLEVLMPKKPNVLVEAVKVPLWENDACKKKWNFLEPNEICFGGNTVAGYKGDSGSPLTVLEETDNVRKYYQIGVISAGNVQTVFNMPTIAERILPKIDWINEVVESTL